MGSKEELEKVRAWLEKLKEDEARLLKELGREGGRDDAGGRGAGPGALIASAKEEDELATMFDKLSGAELYRLYTEDRETWQAIMDAKERAGWKKLGL